MNSRSLNLLNCNILRCAGLSGGAIDPIDGVPYLVSEWSVGESLREFLNGEKLEPAQVTDMMRLALEVSLAVSKAVGKESLWVATDLDSVFVNDAESGCKFSFWLSPIHLLAPQTEAVDFSGLVTFGEELAGWRHTLVSDQAGGGLGGWFKWLKDNPAIRIRQALESLPGTASKELPSSDNPLPNPASASPAVVLNKPFSKKPLLVAGLLAFVVLSILLGYFVRTKEKPLAGEAPAESKAFKANKSMNPYAHAELDRVAKITGKSGPAPTVVERPEPYFLKMRPEQLGLMRQQTKGTPIELTGKLKDVSMNRSKSVIVLKFERGRGTAPILGVISRQDYQGAFSVASLRPYIGKVIRVRGTSNFDRTKKCRDVLLKRFQDIALANG